MAMTEPAPQDEVRTCAGSDARVILDGPKAVCRGCGAMVKITLADGLWRFVEHKEGR